VRAITNPYTPNADAEPQAVVGRDDQLESFDLLLSRIERERTEQSMIITGLRGVGKTVLLGQFRAGAGTEKAPRALVGRPPAARVDARMTGHCGVVVMLSTESAGERSECPQPIDGSAVDPFDVQRAPVRGREDRPFQLGHGERGPGLQQQRRQPGHVRGGHR